MEAPKEIYVPVSNGKISGLWKDVPFNTNDKGNVQENIKYIRSDLTGLTWEDVRTLCSLSFAVEVDLGREVTDKQHYGEVLRRFLEFKNK